MLTPLNLLAGSPSLATQTQKNSSPTVSRRPKSATGGTIRPKATERPRASEIFTARGSVDLAKNLAGPVMKHVGTAVLTQLQPREVAHLASLYYSNLNMRNADRPRNSPDEIILREQIGPLGLFTEKQRRKIYSAMPKIRSARRGQEGSSWSVSAQDLVVYALNNGIEMSSQKVGIWYQREIHGDANGEYALDVDARQRVVDYFDGSSPISSN